MDTEIRNILSMLMGFYMSRELRQKLRGKSDGANHTGDQHLCFFCCIDSTSPLFSTSKISCPFSSSVAVQPGLFWAWSETLKTGSRRGSYMYKDTVKFLNFRTSENFAVIYLILNKAKPYGISQKDAS